VLQVREHLLLLPLVGGLDSQRAQQATGAMLEAIRVARAQALVLDVSGVPSLDSGVALHLNRAVEAARLMGARVFVTGISTAMARAMVTLGAELKTVDTFSTLQGGLEAAVALLDASALPALAEA
jgi:rsbT co-antagonist protein RsbR